MGTLVAVKGCTLKLSSGSAEIKTDPSKYTLLCNKNAYRGDITISVSDSKGDNGIVDIGDGKGSATLSGTGENMQIDGMNAVLEGDNVTVTINGKKSGPNGSTLAASDTVKVTISKAGQDYVFTT